MTLNLFFHALWTLSALGVVVCAAETKRLGHWCLFAAAFSASLWWFGVRRAPDPAWVGFITAAAAAHRLMWPRKTALIAATGGLLAGVCATLLSFEGVPGVAAIIAVTMLAAGADYLSRVRPRFAPPSLREEAAIALIVLSLGVAMAPGVVTGWRAAQALNLPDKTSSAPMVPSWVIAVGSGAIFLGGAHRLWRR